MLEPWYKNAIIYQLHVETFADGDGDGIGDFRGLAERLDHLESLGVTCVWLLPFYPSPNRDNGYDVSDYYGVNPRLGTLGDFVEFSHALRDRGMRLIVDLVLNHSSDRHPWFQDARRSPESKYRDFYIWSKEEPRLLDQGVVFPGYQERTWEWDEQAEAWYFHRFYSHQPDLNIANPRVREEMLRIMGFWLQLGVSGFRLDAAPFLIETIHPQGTSGDQHFEFLTEMRAFLSWRRGDAMLLAEANVPVEEIADYVQDDVRMHMMFNFLNNQSIFLALRQRRSAPLRNCLQALPALPPKAQWAQFLRNHDELDLGRLSAVDRRDIFSEFAPDPSMQLYDRGIRRRLAPMLGNDRQRIEMAYSLMFSLPGTPVLYYGEEIGMGDDLSLPERMAIRTPMQWSVGPNAGFSTAPPERLVRPIVRDPDFGPEAVNVEAQQRDPDSLMSHIQRLMRLRRLCPEIGSGTTRLIDCDRPAVFSHRCTWRGGAILTVHNLGEEEVDACLTLEEDERDRLVELLSDRGYPEPADGRVRLGRYGYRWFRIGARPQDRGGRQG